MSERADNSAVWVLRRTAKAVIAGALCGAGARWWVRSAARRAAGGERVLIVSYHLPTRDFAATARDVLPSLLVSTATLKKQLQQLAREREIVTLDEVCRRLARPIAVAPARRPPADVATITFDDGYADVHALALPVLRELHLTATVFVPTGLVGSARRLLHDRLFAALLEMKRREILPEMAGLDVPLQRVLSARVGRGVADTLDRLISEVPHETLLELAKGLERHLDFSESDLSPVTRIMTWKDLRALQAGGVAIGGHTVNHVALANVALRRARAEIAGCFDDLRQRLGESPRHFAYPNGYHSSRIRGFVREVGFASGETTEDRENQRGGDLFALRRKTLWENSTLGALRYSAAVASCTLDGVFGALGWQRAECGERPDPPQEENVSAM